MRTKKCVSSHLIEFKLFFRSSDSMLALNMKAKSTKTCKTDKSYPHVSQKSSKISKMPCSVVRVIHESADLNTPIQMPKNGELSDVMFSAYKKEKKMQIHLWINANCFLGIFLCQLPQQNYSVFIIELDMFV